MPKKTHPVRSQALPVHIALWADGPHGPISQTNRSLTHVEPTPRTVHSLASMPDPYRHGPGGRYRSLGHSACPALTPSRLPPPIPSCRDRSAIPSQTMRRMGEGRSSSGFPLSLHSGFHSPPITPAATHLQDLDLRVRSRHDAGAHCRSDALLLLVLGFRFLRAVGRARSTPRQGHLTSARARRSPPHRASMRSCHTLSSCVTVWP